MATPDTSLIIADTSGIYSLINQDDRNHEAALEASTDLQQEQSPILVPWEVFTETVNILGKKVNHDLAVRAGRHLLASPAFAIIETQDTARAHALDRFEAQPQSVSFTDCVVMAVAEEYGTKRVFGFDEAFAKNGYRIIGEEVQRRAA